MTHAELSQSLYAVLTIAIACVILSPIFCYILPDRDLRVH